MGKTSERDACGDDTERKSATASNHANEHKHTFAGCHCSRRSSACKAQPALSGYCTDTTPAVSRKARGANPADRR